MIKKIRFSNDKFMVGAALFVSVAAIISCWIGVRALEDNVLRYEAEKSALTAATFLRETIPNLSDILAGASFKADDRRILDSTSKSSKIFRYKFFDRHGKIVHASRPADIGKANIKWYFHDLVKKGESFEKIERDEDFGSDRKVVSEAYTPIMANGVFQGAIEVYVDVTDRAVILRSLGNNAIGALFLLLLIIGSTMGLVVARNIRGRTQAMILAESASRIKSDFLATMSHEIRTPLHGVLGINGLLLGTDLNEKQRKYAETIKKSGDTLLGLINDILDLSKIETGKFELEEVDFQLQQLLDSVSGVMESRAKQKGCDFDVEAAPDVPNVLRGDAGRIRQILFNLVGNAIKFTDFGEIKVHVFQSSSDGDQLSIRFNVSDTGIGLTPDQQKSVFGRFSQADSSTTRKYGGTGLGLAICKDIVESLGGSIGVNSNPGKGSTFWFDIPCKTGIADNVDERLLISPSVREIEKDKTPATLQVETSFKDFIGLRILLAEDNPVNQLIAVETLKSAGHNVDVVSNGIDAIQAVIDQPYDIVLMDIFMPEMDGIVATKAIRKLTGAISEIPIIALTADAMEGEREKYLAAGMTDYISKPFDESQLFGTIARHTPAHPPVS